MAQTITTATVSRVNRRFLLLAIVLAILSAVLVYAQMSRSSDKGGSSSAGDVSVVVAKAAIPAGTRISADLVAVRSFSQSDVGFQALSDPSQAVGQVVRYPITAGEQILSSKLVDTTITSSKQLAYVLEPGMRGLSISVKQVTTAGGLVIPGDHVDLLWIPVPNGPAFVLLTDVEVTAVAQTVVDVAPAAPGVQTDPGASNTGDRTRIFEAEPKPDAVTATLMVTPEQAVNLFCASQIGEISMAVRSFGDKAPLAPNAPACPPQEILRQFGVIQ